MAAAAAPAAAGRGDADEEKRDLSNPAVADKYREAGKVVNFALEAVIAQLAPGKTIVELCEFGDAIIEAQTSKLFKSAKIEKGVAFPTCVSVNECCGNYSPLKDVGDTLKAGDMVKIDLGVHFDGFAAVGAHTVVVPGGDATVTGRRADVVAAAFNAAQLAVRLIKPGNKNTGVTAGIATVASAYGVNPVQGVLMHDMPSHLLDGDKTIMLRGDNPEHKVEEFAFAMNEVYAVDVIMSTGDGKPRELDARTTIYKLNPDATYRPKMSSGHAVVSEVTRRFMYFPFTARALGDEKEPRKQLQALMGITELTKHDVLHGYPVLYEHRGTQVAHFKFTVLLLPGGTLQITGLPMPAVTTAKKVPDDIAAALATEPYVKPAKKGGKAAAATTTAGGGEGGATAAAGAGGAGTA